MSRDVRAPLGWLTAAAHRMCPSCGAPELLPGPRGGSFSQNFYCTKCALGWNVHSHPEVGVLDVDALGETRPELIQFYLGVADGLAIHRAELEAAGHNETYIASVLDALFDRLARSGLPPLRVTEMAKQIREARRVGNAQMRAMLEAEGFTREQIDELFEFAQLVQPDGSVVYTDAADMPTLSGILRRLWGKPS